jgi:hypothetical protein
MNNFESFISQDIESVKKAVTDNIQNRADEFGSGVVHELYSLNKYPGIVVKRVRFDARMIARCGGDKTKAIQKLKEEHEYMAAYLSGHVPKTVFMELDLGSGEEWLMIQERAKGIKDLFLDFGNRPVASEELKSEFRQFKERYKRMRNSGKVPEDQIMVDFDNAKIWAYDTNFLRSSEDMLKAESIFSLVNDRPLSGKAEDVWAFLQKHFSSARQLDIKNKNAFLKGISGDTYMALLDEIKRLKGADQIGADLLREMKRICVGLAYFPPADFEDNIFTLSLAEKLKI